MCIWKHISNLLQPRFCSLASTLLILNMKRFSSHSLLERYVHTYKCIYRHSRYKATHLHLIFNTVVNIHLISMFWVFTLSDFNAIFINKQIISTKLLFFSRVAERCRNFKCENGFYWIFPKKIMAEEVDLKWLYGQNWYCWPIAKMSGSTELTMGEAIHVVSVGTEIGKKKVVSKRK